MTNCQISIFNYCVLIQETFKSPIFNFGDVDISNDTFVYKVFKYYGGAETIFSTNFIDNNTIYIENISMPIGDYQHELSWTRNGVTEVVFQGELKVTNLGNNCGCTSNNLNIKVVNQDIVVNIAYSERIIERITDKGIQGDSAYQVAVDNGFVGTEAEWLESLKGDKGDVGEQGVQGIQGEQGFNGWTPIHEFEADGAQRQVKKLVDYIGGTGDKPTQNIGQYVIDNGYTSDKSLATNFKGEQSDNLLLEYVHSGNKEIYIESYDETTGIFTAENHGLVNGNNVRMYINKTGSFYPKLLNYIMTNTPDGGEFFIVNSTSDTFQISATNGGTPLVLAKSSGFDLTKWHFEIVSTNFINLSGIDFIDTIISVEFERAINALGLAVRFNANNQNGMWYSDYTNNQAPSNSAFVRTALHSQGNFEIKITKSDLGIFANINVNIHTNLNKQVNNYQELLQCNSLNEVTSVQFLNHGFANGTTIKIYKL